MDMVMTAEDENPVLRSQRSPAKGSTRFQCTTCQETFQRADHLLRHGSTQPPASGHPLIDSSAVAKQQGALGIANYSNRYKPGQKTSDEFQLSPPNTGDENQRTPSCQRAVI
ncbi:hypothetical protein McaMca56_004123 [Microsporum canis]